MKNKKVHKFNSEWFKSQFGSRPKESIFKLRNEVERLERCLYIARYTLNEAELYYAKEDAALKSFVNTIFQVEEKRINNKKLNKGA